MKFSSLAVLKGCLAAAVLSAPAFAISLSVSSFTPTSAVTGASISAALTGTSFDGTAAVTVERFDVTGGTWAATGAMSLAKYSGGGVLLNDGRVLFAGGQQGGTNSISSVTIYVSTAGTWMTAAPMLTPRQQEALVVLQDGRVLAVGGLTSSNQNTDTPTAEIYDPTSDTWTATVSLSSAVHGAPAILLSDGRVLLAGGQTGGTMNTVAQIFNPSSGTWTTSAMAYAHAWGGLTTLNDGRVFAAGGTSANSVFVSGAEIFNPTSSAWTTVASMAAAREVFGLATLPDGRVMAAGGTALAGTLATTEIYDPTGNTWTAGPNLSVARRSDQTLAAHGRVLVISGYTGSGDTAAVDVYDPSSNTWKTGGSLVTARDSGAAVQLADGRVLVAGGFDTNSLPLASAEILTMSSSVITATGVSVADAQHLSATVNLSSAPTGYWDAVVRESGSRTGRLGGWLQVKYPTLAPFLSVASVSPSTGAYSSSVNPALTGTGFDGTAAITLERFNVSYGSWTAGVSMSTGRIQAVTVTLNDGRVLVAGGYHQGVSAALTSAELYDPVAGTWSPAASMSVGRQAGMGVLMADGRVLVASGQTTTSQGSETLSAEIYDPASNTWSTTVSMSTGVHAAPAILLSNGKVLIAGGQTGAVMITVAQIYDPVSVSWSTAAMNYAHAYGGVVNLSDGRAFIAGGTSANSVFVAGSDIYNPATGVWSAGASMAAARELNGVALLPDGRVLSAGGTALAGPLATSEIYDPTANSWTAGPNLSAARRAEQTIAVNGRVLVIGGALSAGISSAVDVFDPTTLTFSTAGALNAVRDSAYPVQLGDGRVLLVGGNNATGLDLATAEIMTAAKTSFALTGVSASNATHVSGSVALTGATTGYYDVAVKESANRAARLQAGFLVKAPPPTPFFSVATISPSTAAVGASVTAAATGTNFDGTAALSLERPAVAGGAWSATGSMGAARMAHATVVLSDGRVLAAGGQTGGTTTISSVTIYDPTAGTWSAIAPLPTARQQPALVALQDGRVLAAGGMTTTSVGSDTSAVEIYDPSANVWTAAASLPIAEHGAPAILLSDGRVLLAGGQNGNTMITTAQIYDVASGSWTTSTMSFAHAFGAAVTLQDGRVLVAAGSSANSVFVAGSDIFNPTTNAWSSAASLSAARELLGLAVLPDGRVLAAGGTALSGPLSSCEIYDPAANSWTAGPSLSVARYGDQTIAVDGRVVVISGYTGSGVSNAVDVYDPAANAWTAGGSVITARESMTPVRLGSGRVLIAGGFDNSSHALASTELLVMSSTTITATGVSASDASHLSGSLSLAGAATGYWDVVVRESGGRFGRIGAGFQIKVPVPASDPYVSSVSPSSGTAGTSSVSAAVVGSAFDGTATPSLEHFGVANGSWTAAAPLSVGRIQAGNVLLKDGRVLVAGGYPQSTQAAVKSADLYDPITGNWSPATPMSTARLQPALVVMSDGRVLAAGGMTTSTTGTDTGTVEIYDPAGDSWTAAASLPTAVHGAPAILLSDGRVLLAGGQNGSTMITTAQIYDPTAGTWSTSAMSFPHAYGGAVTLKNGRVLVAAGSSANSVFVSSAEIFNPTTNLWSGAAPLAAARELFGMAPLPDGRVMAAGGTALAGPLATSEIYDPTANTWTAGPNLSVARRAQQTLAVNGRVLVAGGTLSSGVTGAVDVYDPATNAFTTAPSLITARDNTSPPLQLGDGRVLLPGGSNGSGLDLSSVELLTMPVSTIAASGVSVADSQHLSGNVSLAGVTTGYWDVVVRASGSRAGRLSAGFQVLLPSPLSPPPLAGAVLGTSSIAWSWSLVSGATSYHVFDTTGADKSGQLSAATTSWIETGLTANSLNARRVGDFSQFFSSYSASTSVYTAAAPPTGTAVSSFSATSVSLTWSANGNPAATTAAVERSTDAASYSQVYSSAVLTFSDSGLASCTSYYYRVRNFNGVGAPTAYDAVQTARTLGATPSPPDALTAQAANGGLVVLSWLASPTAGIAGYHLYASTSVLSYATPYATLAAGTTGYTTPALSTGTVVRFGLRAYSCGIEEANTNVVASATPLTSTAGLSAAIKVPQSGKKVAGNSVTVMAEIVSGDATRVASVRFQYRSAASTSAAWIDIPASDSQHPNPATSAPYFIHWDVTGVPNASYELRAVAAATDNTVDPAPSTVVINVDAVTPDSTQSVSAGSESASQTVYNGAQSVVSLADSASGAVAAVTMPGGVVSASTDTLNVQVNPSGVPAPSKNQVSLGQVVQLSLTSGQTSLNGTASITMTYQDANNTGVVDGTAIRVDHLVILTYNTASGQWRQESTPVVDKNAKTITATTPHFSLFGLFATAATDLSNVLVYPVPWLPNAGNANTGKPFSSGDATSGIVFDGVTDNVRIQIFTASGALVWERSVNGSGGHVQWDGRNTNGHDAASGGYLAVITDLGGGTKLVRKIAIIR